MSSSSPWTSEAGLFSPLGSVLAVLVVVETTCVDARFPSRSSLEAVSCEGRFLPEGNDGAFVGGVDGELLSLDDKPLVLLDDDSLVLLDAEACWDEGAGACAVCDVDGGRVGSEGVVSGAVVVEFVDCFF